MLNSSSTSLFNDETDHFEGDDNRTILLSPQDFNKKKSIFGLIFSSKKKVFKKLGERNSEDSEDEEFRDLGKSNSIVNIIQRTLVVKKLVTLSQVNKQIDYELRSKSTDFLHQIEDFLKRNQKKLT